MFKDMAYKSFGTSDFVAHYFNGRGRPIDLARVGLLPRFRSHPSVRGAVNQWSSRQIEKAMNLASLACVTAQDRKSFIRRIERDEDVAITDVTTDSALFSVGSSSFFRFARWSLDVDCGKGRYKMEGVLRFEIRDRFSDPLDLGALFRRDVEMARGTPFPISAAWQVPLQTSGVVR